MDGMWLIANGRIAMNVKHGVPALLAGIVALCAVVSTLNAQSKTPVYAVIDISEVLDADAFVKALSAAEPKATQSAGGRFIVRTNKAIALDGGAPPKRFVVIAFDNEEQAKSQDRYGQPRIPPGSRRGNRRHG